MKFVSLSVFAMFSMIGLCGSAEAQAICNKGYGDCGAYNSDFGVYCASWTRPCYNYGQTTTCADFPECGVDPDPDNNRLKFSRKKPMSKIRQPLPK
jgi:hypothetical protein